MRINLKLLALTFTLICCSSAIAEVTVATSPNVSGGGSAGQLDNTNATTFAIQAGAIAGVAQACGQDITTFLTRVNEALDRISFSSNDKVLAQARFQQALQQAGAAQANEHPFSCPEAIADFNSLPLMRDDYRISVLKQLNPTIGTNLPPNSGQPNLAQPPADRVAYPPPNINTIAPAGYPPPPDFPPNYPGDVQAGQPRNIIEQSPGIAPTVDTTRGTGQIVDTTTRGAVPREYDTTRNNQTAPNINDVAPNPWANQNPPTNISNPYAGVPQPYQNPPPPP